MPVLIIDTKLFVPPPPPHVVSRPRLTGRLNENLRQSGGFARKLTLISAPAGFGKTTIVAEWLNQRAEADETVPRSPVSSQFPEAHPFPKVAWLSLDEEDSDPTRFLTYLVAAIQTVAPDIGRGIPDALQAAQPPIDSILTVLLNELGSLSDNLLLVLDDYHVIDAKPVDQALTFLVEHLPPQVHLVITTREDPQLPLPRLRARGQLTELRAADLRFSSSEAAEFLNSVMGLKLSAQEIAELEGRTEGWVAGLQLAGLAVQGQFSTHAEHDVSEFIHAFAGDHRYIVDYLVEEVLQRQPEPVRRFLLQTCILERLNGALCDAVTGQAGGSAQLEALERGNFFVVPLDDKRHWYRYHHLFGQVLYARLKAEQPEQIPLLHQRASEWYEQNGLTENAIRHAFAAEDFERAADLVELALPAIRKSRQDTIRLGWIKALPDEILYYRPVLSVEYAHMLLASGVREGVEERLRDAERWLDTNVGSSTGTDVSAARDDSTTSRRMVSVDEEAFHSLPGAIAIARAGLTLARGDVPASVTYARQALDLATEEDYITRGGAAGFLGLAAWTRGDLEQAHRMYADGMASLQRAGNIADAVNGAVTLAGIRIAQGRLREAMRAYERGLQLGAEHGTPAFLVRGTADMYVGMSELAYEHNALPLALQHLQTSKERGELEGFPQNRYRGRVAMARIRQAQGDLEGALALLDEAARLYMSDFSPNVRPISALIARVWIVQGELGQASDWARERGLSVADEMSYDREFEHITLARLFLAEYRRDTSDSVLDDAAGLLARLLEAAEQGGRMGSEIEILILLALTNQLQGDMPAAFAPLERALTLAEPEGYVRIFVDEGSPMAQLLGEAAAHGIAPYYTGKLLAAFGEEQTKSRDEPSLSPIAASLPLFESLTEREVEILRLFFSPHSGPEIADKLVIALSTLRTHTKNIYSKLDVNSRRAAVNRAQELHLI